MIGVERIFEMIASADDTGKTSSAKRRQKLLLGEIRGALSRAPNSTILIMERRGRDGGNLTATGKRVSGWVGDEIKRRGLTVLRVIPGGKP